MKFRGGNAFIISIVIFIISWFTLRSIYHFDPDYGLLNLILSMEASLATCLLLDQTQRQYEQDHQLIADEAEALTEIQEDLESLTESINPKKATI